MIFMSVEGVILAAGLSSRAGAYKLTLPINEKTIIENCIESMYPICSKIIVVGGYKYELLSEILSKYFKVKVINNVSYREGMFNSVKEGIRHVTAERFFLIPGDYPLVRSETYIKMLSIESGIVVPTYEGKKGHPVLIKSCMNDDILYNPRYTNLKEFVNIQGFTTVSVDDQGILLDVDTMEDYNNIVSNSLLINGGVSLGNE